MWPFNNQKSDCEMKNVILEESVKQMKDENHELKETIRKQNEELDNLRGRLDSMSIELEAKNSKLKKIFQLMTS